MDHSHNDKAKMQRILLAEDNALFLSTLTVALSTSEREIITATNGLDALNLFSDHRGNFDVIVTDNDMPEMDGLNLVKAVREAGFEGPIAVMSGNMLPEKLQAYRRYNVGFFQKPFQVREMVQFLSLN
jgi:two-component system, cell cycle sensor histidine kinase and response regulator CckA